MPASRSDSSNIDCERSLRISRDLAAREPVDLGGVEKHQQTKDRRRESRSSFTYTHVGATSLSSQTWERPDGFRCHEQQVVMRQGADWVAVRLEFLAWA
jgi:hypothetical protein